MYARTLQVNKILEQTSLFLFGPRGVGKSTLIQAQLPDVFMIDLLDFDIYQSLMRRPKILEEWIAPTVKKVVIDEIQKIPELLDIVHRLIENRKIKFLLTGSSARKLRRSGTNLLGGRAREYHLFPLTSHEIGIEQLNLLDVFNRGTLPKVFLSNEPEEDLRSYVQLYLLEEIKAEALVRRLEQFVRFLDVMGVSNGEELHFTNLANDTGVAARTLEGYIQVLNDTLVGFQVFPFHKTVQRKAIHRSKFYFFDVGVAGYLAKRSLIKERSELYGRALEHFIAIELRAALEYFRQRHQLMYWRTKNGFEVDFVVGDRFAVEVKATDRVSMSDLRGLKALAEEKKIRHYFVVCQESQLRYHEDIQIMPVKVFLQRIWQASWWSEL